MVQGAPLAGSECHVAVDYDADGMMPARRREAKQKLACRNSQPQVGWTGEVMAEAWWRSGTTRLLLRHSQPLPHTAPQISRHATLTRCSKRAVNIAHTIG